jgi:hypothetical protein
MGSSINTFGGLLVPDELASEIIDLVRAQTVLFRAGTRTVPMISDNVTMARLIADPAMVVKGDEKHQVAIKITWRGDFNLTYPSHFYTLTGISG